MKTYNQLLNNITIIEEETKTQNGHITHFEDMVFYGGSRGVKAALNLAIQLYKSPQSVKLSLKLDGSPALFFGLDPKDKHFFVAKKSIFNNEPKVYKSHAAIDQDIPKAELAHKLHYAFNYLKPLIQEGIYQGDMLYTKNDLKQQTIDGERYVTFHPNTLTYGVPMDEKLAARIINSKIGLAVHTKWAGRDFKSLKPIYQFEKGSIRTSKNVWIFDPYIKTDINIENDNIKVFMKEILNKLPKISKFINEVALSQPLGYIFEAYHNQLVRNGHITDNAYKYVAGLQQFIQSKPKKYHQYFQDQNTLTVVFEIHQLLTDIKMEIVKSLNNNKDLEIKTFIERKNGVVNSSNVEGYVAIGDGGVPLKFIDRLEFSHHNFDDDNIKKGWTK